MIVMLTFYSDTRQKLYIKNYQIENLKLNTYSSMAKHRKFLENQFKFIDDYSHDIFNRNFEYFFSSKALE